MWAQESFLGKSFPSQCYQKSLNSFLQWDDALARVPVPQGLP